jgi:hypothetical protein
MVQLIQQLFEVSMKFLLAIALLIPALAQAAPSTLKIEGDDAIRLGSALKSDSEGDVQSFDSSSLSIECSRARSECSISLSEKEEGKQIYLYRDQDARALYERLKLEEFEGRLGFTKVFAGIDSDFEILCSRFYGSDGESFSCSVDLGK